MIDDGGKYYYGGEVAAPGIQQRDGGALPILGSRPTRRPTM